MKKISTKSTRPRYAIGDIVYYKRIKRKGTIESIINFGDKEDIETQGYRYYVRIGCEVYSIREEWLLLEEKNSNKIKPKMEIASFIRAVGQQATGNEGGRLSQTPEEALLAKDSEKEGGV